jgi:hypothetical protein
MLISISTVTYSLVPVTWKIKHKKAVDAVALFATSPTAWEFFKEIMLYKSTSDAENS